ncbi:MAG: hypothetical protein ACYCSO_00855 [Cuniculiplasma sp.]
MDEAISKQKIFEILSRKVQNFPNNIKSFDVSSENIKFKVIFRYCEIDIGDVFPEKLRLTAISKEADLNKIDLMVFDIVGLDENYITELKLEKDDSGYSVFISPSRDLGKVNLLYSELLQSVD